MSSSRDSRFDKLEQQRKVGTESSPSSLTRFEGAPPGAEPPIERTSPPGEELKRFEHDGGAGLHLDRDALAELPMLQCPSCNRDSSKWDAACIYCQTSLSSPEAIVYNLQLVETRRLAVDTELELARQKREAAMVETANEKAALILSDARHERERFARRRILIGAGVALPALVLVFVLDAYLLKLIFFLVFIIALACALSPAAWAFVRQNRER